MAIWLSIARKRGSGGSAHATATNATKDEATIARFCWHAASRATLSRIAASIARIRRPRNNRGHKGSPCKL